MRVIVKKPDKGRVTVILDDRKGLTRRLQQFKDIAIEDVQTTVGPAVVNWELDRKAITDTFG